MWWLPWGCREIWSAIALDNIICSSRFIYGYGYNL
ncbi:unnamed protein product [Brassica oleracea]